MAFLLNPGQLNGLVLPEDALAELQDSGVEGRIIEEIVSEQGPEVLSEEESLQSVIARAVAGGTIGRAASDLGVQPYTLARRLNGVGLSPRWLRHWARLRAYYLRVGLGMDRRSALSAGGWTDHAQRRKATARFRKGLREQLSVAPVVERSKVPLTYDWVGGFESAKQCLVIGGHGN